MLHSDNTNVLSSWETSLRASEVSPKRVLQITVNVDKPHKSPGLV